MPILKLVEVGVLLIAVVAFAWWQLRDVKRAQEQNRPHEGEAASVDHAAPLEHASPRGGESDLSPAPDSKRP